MYLQADVISLAGPGLFESEEGADLIAGGGGGGMLNVEMSENGIQIRNFKLMQKCRC
jgi:hypothetical protein